MCVFGVSLNTGWTAVRASSHTAVLETPHPLVWFQVRIEDEVSQVNVAQLAHFLFPDEIVSSGLVRVFVCA